MEKQKECPMCYESWPESSFSIGVSSTGIKICPRCVFLVALYHVRGIKKCYVPGCLNPKLLNNQFRKILEEEFYPNAHQTYKKYLGEMIAEQEAAKAKAEAENKHYDVELETVAEVDSVAYEYPFVTLSAKLQKKCPVKVGDVMTIFCGEKSIERKIYAVERFSKRLAKSAGIADEAVWVCFVPPEEYGATDER